MKKISKIENIKTKRTLITTLEPILCWPAAPGHGPGNVVGMCSHTHWRKLSSLSPQVSEQRAPWLGVGVGVRFPFSVLGLCLVRTCEGLRHTIKLCDFHNHCHCWSRRHCFLGATHHLQLIDSLPPLPHRFQGTQRKASIKTFRRELIAPKSLSEHCLVMCL